MLTPPPQRFDTPRTDTQRIDSPNIDTPSWNQVVQTYGMVVLIPVLLWTFANPVLGTVALAGIATAALGVKRLGVLSACLRDCGEFALELGDTARITVSHPPTNDACC